jgi:hypothetical protein
MAFSRDLVAHLWRCIGRRDSYAVQLASGTYARVNSQVTARILAEHLEGSRTIGTYVIDERGCCSFAVLDADQENGLDVLRAVQAELAAHGVVLHLERSRRGGHGWMWFDRAVKAMEVRAFLAPFASRHGLELYPKQAASRGVGSLIRVPFGVHRRSGERYPFLDDAGQPIARTLLEALTWLPTARISQLPTVTASSLPSKAVEQLVPTTSVRRSTVRQSHYTTIREWNAAHDPFTVIGRYVELDSRGAGHCPFGEHHAGGRDEHRSFQVYQPHQVGGYCWLCHAGEIGGSLFDFLCRYHGKSARELWYQIQHGGGELW